MFNIYISVSIFGPSINICTFSIFSSIFLLNILFLYKNCISNNVQCSDLKYRESVKELVYLQRKICSLLWQCDIIERKAKPLKRGFCTLSETNLNIDIDIFSRFKGIKKHIYSLSNLVLVSFQMTLSIDKKNRKSLLFL